MIKFSFHCSENGRNNGDIIDPETFRPRRSGQQSRRGGAEDTGGADGYPQPEPGL